MKKSKEIIKIRSALHEYRQCVYKYRDKIYNSKFPISKKDEVVISPASSEEIEELKVGIGGIDKEDVQNFQKNRRVLSDFIDKFPNFLLAEKYPEKVSPNFYGEDIIPLWKSAKKIIEVMEFIYYINNMADSYLGGNDEYGAVVGSMGIDIVSNRIETLIDILNEETNEKDLEKFFIEDSEFIEIKPVTVIYKNGRSVLRFQDIKEPLPFKKGRGEIIYFLYRQRQSNKRWKTYEDIKNEIKDYEQSNNKDIKNYIKSINSKVKKHTEGVIEQVIEIEQEDQNNPKSPNQFRWFFN